MPRGLIKQGQVWSVDQNLSTRFVLYLIFLIKLIQYLFLEYYYINQLLIKQY